MYLPLYSEVACVTSGFVISVDVDSLLASSLETMVALPESELLDMMFDLSDGS